MPFDQVMGVGRSPKITEDLKFSPYSLITSDLAPVGEIIAYNFYQNLRTLTGNMNDIINPEFDYTTATPYSIQAYQSGSSDMMMGFTLDLKKNTFLAKFSVDFSYQVIAGAPMDIYEVVQYLNESNTWITIYSNRLSTFSGTSARKNITINFVKARYIRFFILSDNAVAGDELLVSIFKARAFPDTVQYNYL